MLAYSNSKSLIAVFASALLFVAAPASAAVLLYNFDNPTGTLGTSQSYTNSGVTITAYGFNGTNTGTATNLYGKNEGGDEIGLGIASTSDHEIETYDFVQLNLSQLFAANPGVINMQFGSVQPGESWKLYGSNTLGTLGTFIQSGTADYGTNVALSSAFSGYTYLSIQAGYNDILVSTLSTNISVPEPGTYLLLGSMLGLALFAKRRVAKAIN